MMECEESNGSGGLKRKTRKRRRATGAGATLQTHTSEHISTNHQISPSNLPHPHGNIIQYYVIFFYYICYILWIQSTCFFFHTVANTRSDTNVILSSMLLVAVLCLMVINGLLYYKLWGLEEAAAYTIMDLHVLKYILSISFI